MLNVLHTRTHTHPPMQRDAGNFKKCWICLEPSLWWWYHWYMHMSKCIKMYALKIHNFSYINYVSIKLWNKKGKIKHCFSQMNLSAPLQLLCFQLYCSASALFDQIGPLIFQVSEHASFLPVNLLYSSRLGQVPHVYAPSPFVYSPN